MGRPAIFLDRDGVLNENRANYVRTWNEFTFLPGTFAAMKALSALGAPIVIVTNQAGVGRGLIPRDQIDVIHQRMAREIARHGVRIEGIYLCPHTSNDDCQCRKPKPGMLLRAAEQLGLDLEDSVIVGDAETDIAAGRIAGCRTVLVLTGRGRDAAEMIGKGTCHDGVPHAVVDDLQAAVPIITRMLAPNQSRSGWSSWLRYAQPSLSANDLVANSLTIGKG